MRDALSDFTGTVCRAVDDYRMIQEGDRVAVGVSGGRTAWSCSSRSTACGSITPKPFELEAVTIELGFEGMDFTPVRGCAGNSIYRTPASKLDIKGDRLRCAQEDNPRSLCARCARRAQ